MCEFLRVILPPNRSSHDTCSALAPSGSKIVFATPTHSKRRSSSHCTVRSRRADLPLPSAPRPPVTPYLHTPPTFVLSPCASQTPAGDIKHLSQPTLTNKDSSLPKNECSWPGWRVYTAVSVIPFLFTTRRLRQTKLSKLSVKYGAHQISLRLSRHPLP